MLARFTGKSFLVFCKLLQFQFVLTISSSKPPSLRVHLCTFPPIAALSNELRELLQVLLINMVESIELRAVDINDGHQFGDVSIPDHNGDDDLALAVAVTRNVPGELLDIRDQLRRPARGRCSAHAPAKDDGLARHLALERAEYELRLVGRSFGVYGVETCTPVRIRTKCGAARRRIYTRPVHLAAWCWQRFVCVP